MKRRESPPPPPTPSAGSGRRWLLVGEGVLEAATPDVTLSRAPGVHEALEALAWRRFERVLVAEAALRDRHRAALRALARRATDGSLAILGAVPSQRLRRAASAVGVAILDGPPSPPSPLPDGGRLTAPPAPPADPGVRPALPRADDAAQAPQPSEAGSFAAGCLARVARPGALAAYLLRTLAEISDAARVSLMLRDGTGSMLVLRAARGVAPDLVGKVRVPLGVGVAGRAAALGRPLVGLGARGGPRAYPGACYVVLPLGTERSSEGVASLTGFPHDRAPGDEAVRAWALLAAQAGKALHAARRLKRAEARSSRDALTTLPNRRAFERALRRELDRATRGARRLGVAVLDVDRFKGINDTYGHPAGDRVLAEVARRLTTALRESDLVARWGGEEFALLLPDLGPGGEDEALVAVERVRRAVSGRPIPLGVGQPSIVVTISGGLAVGPLPEGDGTLLVHAADQALLAAKQGGRDRIVAALA